MLPRRGSLPHDRKLARRGIPRRSDPRSGRIIGTEWWCPVVSRSITSSPSCPVARTRPRPWSVRWSRSAPRCGERATRRSRRPWWCATSARVTRSPAKPVGSRRSRLPRGHSTAAADQQRIKPLLLPMTEGPEPDVFHGQFAPDRVGLWTFRVDGWGDPIDSWRHGLLAKLEAGQGETELSNDLLIGAALFERAATGVPRASREPLLAAATALRTPGDPVTRTAPALAPEIDGLLASYPLRELVTRGEQYGVWVDRPLARFGSWYEMFPRSTGGWDTEGKPVHGTFATAAEAAPPDREDGIRRRLPAADPSDRQGTPQGPQQHRHRRARRCRLTVGDRQRRGRPRRRPPRAGHHRRLRRLRRRGARLWAWRWRSTWRCSAHPITRGPATTASGSPNCPTAPSPTRRTRRRSTRTSIR